MSRKSWIRVAEIILVLPATVYLAPLAAFSALGVMFAIVQDVGLGFTAEFMLIRVMASFLAAPVGMISLWIAMMMPYGPVRSQRNLRILLVIGIGVGIADVIYWLWFFSRQPSTDWGIWLVMLGGPIIVGTRYALRLALSLIKTP